MPRIVDAEVRSEAHNTSVDTVAAVVGACGQTHLSTGRVCTLPERHQGSCEFTPRDDVDRVIEESTQLATP